MNQPTIYIEEFGKTANLFVNASYPGGTVRFENRSDQDIRAVFADGSPFGPAKELAIPACADRTESVIPEASGLYLFTLGTPEEDQVLRIHVGSEANPFQNGVRWAPASESQSEAALSEATWLLFAPDTTRQVELRNLTQNLQRVIWGSAGSSSDGNRDILSNTATVISLPVGTHRAWTCRLAQDPRQNQYPFLQNGGTRQIELIIE